MPKRVSKSLAASGIEPAFGQLGVVAVPCAEIAGDRVVRTRLSPGSLPVIDDQKRVCGGDTDPAMGFGAQGGRCGCVGEGTLVGVCC